MRAEEPAAYRTTIPENIVPHEQHVPEGSQTIEDRREGRAFSRFGLGKGLWSEAQGSGETFPSHPEELPELDELRTQEREQGYRFHTASLPRRTSTAR